MAHKTSTRRKSPKAPVREGNGKPETRHRTRRRPDRKPFPTLPFEQALRFGQGVEKVGAGQPVKRATLFEKLNLPTNRMTRELITASSKYSVTNGGHDARKFSLTRDGAKAAELMPSPERNRVRIKLAITDIEPFRQLYEMFQGGKMPAIEVMRDTLEDLNEADRATCVDLFVQNAKFVGILQTREGAEFFASADDAVAWTGDATKLLMSSTTTPMNMPVVGEDYGTVCFFIAPIGPHESEQRRHSDAILSSFVEKALAMVEPKRRVVRADTITQPGLITKQVVEYLLHSQLVIADLSYHNPNVFYELAVRHATGKPVIHIKRTSDPIPFDNKDFRTIDIAFENKFDILAELETARSTIANFARQSLVAGDNSENPLLAYLPDHRFEKAK